MTLAIDPRFAARVKRDERDALSTCDFGNLRRARAGGGPCRVGHHAAGDANTVERRVVLADSLKHAAGDLNARAGKRRKDPTPHLGLHGDRRQRKLHRARSRGLEARYQLFRIFSLKTPGADGERRW